MIKAWIRPRVEYGIIFYQEFEDEYELAKYLDENPLMYIMGKVVIDYVPWKMA